LVANELAGEVPHPDPRGWDHATVRAVREGNLLSMYLPVVQKGGQEGRGTHHGAVL